MRVAEQVGEFDSLFFNTAGRLVEGGRNSVFLQIDGRWHTPPLASDKLPDVMRGLRLEASIWSATEHGLEHHNLHRARSIMLCNALRSPVMARLLERQHSPA